MTVAVGGVPNSSGTPIVLKRGPVRAWGFGVVDTWSSAGAKAGQPRGRSSYRPDTTAVSNKRISARTASEIVNEMLQ